MNITTDLLNKVTSPSGPQPTYAPVAGPTSPVMDANKLTSTKPVTLSQQNPVDDGQSSLQALTAEQAQAQVDSMLANGQQNQGMSDLQSQAMGTSQLELDQTDLQKRISAASDKLLGKQEAQINADTEVGLPNLNNQLTQVNSQINALTREAQAIPLIMQQQAQGRGITAAGLRPLETSRIRENTIQALGLSAIAQTLQGNIAMAQQRADRAVALQFAPAEAELAKLKQDFEMNKFALEREDKKRAKALELSIAEKTSQLNSEREDKKTIISWAAEASKNNAPQTLVNRALSLNSPQAALSLLGSFLQDPTAKAQALANLELTRANTARIYQDNQKSEAERQKILSESNADSESAKKMLQNNEALTLVNQLLKNDAPGKASAVGASFSKLVPYAQEAGLQGDRTAFEAKVNSLKANLTLDNLKLLKGAMSDKDLLFLNAVGSSLDTNMSQSEFDKELVRIQEKLIKAGATAIGDTVVMVGPGGTYEVPADKVDIFTQNGYKQQ